MQLKIFCIYYNGYPIIKNQTLEKALLLLERSEKYRIGIQLNNN
jgi:hypothetical protein